MKLSDIEKKICLDINPKQNQNKMRINYKDKSIRVCFDKHIFN